VSWRYCDNCDSGLDEPTIEEDLSYDGWTCPYCNHEQGRCHSDTEWLLKLHEELQELKANLRSHEGIEI